MYLIKYQDSINWWLDRGVCIQNPYRIYVPVNIAVRIFLWMGRRCMYTLFHMEEEPSSAGRIAIRVATYHTYTGIGYNAFCCTTTTTTDGQFYVSHQVAFVWWWCWWYCMMMYDPAGYNRTALWSDLHVQLSSLWIDTPAGPYYQTQLNCAYMCSIQFTSTPTS